MPQFRRHKNGKAFPITPKRIFVTPESIGGYRLELFAHVGAQAQSKEMLDLFNQNSNDRKKQILIKRATVSASNKAKSQGNTDVSKLYEDAYKQMKFEAPRENITTGASPKQIELYEYSYSRMLKSKDSGNFKVFAVANRESLRSPDKEQFRIYARDIKDANRILFGKGRKIMGRNGDYNATIGYYTKDGKFIEGGKQVQPPSWLDEELN